MAARFLFKEFFDMQSVAKFWIATNHKPEIRGTDPAIWDRIVLVPFNVRIPQRERDMKLGDKLRTEAAGIFNWMVGGCLEWQKEGLAPPAAVREATKQYRREMDIVWRWFEERCQKSDDPEDSINAAPAYKDFNEWLTESGEKLAVTQRRFGEEIKRLGIPKKRGSKGMRYEGVAWRNKGS